MGMHGLAPASRRWRDAWRGFARGIAAPLLASCLLAAVPAGAGAGADAPPARQENCGTSHLRIHYFHPVDRDHACEAWRRVSAFLLDGHGLRVTAPVELIFAERVELDFGPQRFRVLGHYDRMARIVRVTSMTADWLREPDRLMFRLPINEEMHTSVVAHELAHAVLLDNFRVAHPGRACGEYLAYVVQLATMEPGMRERVLAQYEEGDFASLDNITEICHLMRPHEFGVRAYRHFAREGHGYMLELILSGGLQTDLPPM